MTAEFSIKQAKCLVSGVHNRTVDLAMLLDVLYVVAAQANIYWISITR